MLSSSRLLLLGLALGGIGSWITGLGSRTEATRTLAPDAAASGPFVLPAWSWRDSATPPSLHLDDSAAAISAWLAQRSPDGHPADFRLRVRSLRALLPRIPAQGFPRLLDACATAPTDNDKRLRRLAFDAWLLKDPESASRWAVSQSPKPLLELAADAVRAWAERDAPAAAAWTCGLRDEDAARQLASIALAKLAEQDPPRAIALARTRNDAFREAAFYSIMETLGRSDPAAVVRTFAPEFANDSRGLSMLHGPISEWFKKDPAAATAWLIVQPSRYEGELGDWIVNFSRGAPQTRRHIADAIIAAPGVANRAAVLGDLLFGWSTANPDEALAWINGIADPDLRIDLLERSNRSYFTNNPEKSLPFALAMPQGANRAERISILLDAWAKIDADATLAWMRAHASEPGVSAASTAVHKTLLAALAAEDPSAAVAEWSQIADPLERAVSLQTIAQTWGQKDPAAALRWMEAQQSTEPTRSYGGNGDLIFRWAKTEPEAALRWVEDWVARLPENLRADLAPSTFDALGGQWNEKAPRATTADLYTKIKDPKLRTETLTRHVREWLTKDPAGARAWLDSHDALSPAQAAALLAPAE